MKHTLQRSLSLLLVLLMLLSPLTVHASMAAGDDLSSQSTQLHSSVTLTKNIFYSNSRSDLRTEHFVTYLPNSAVTPLVTYGETSNSRESVGDAAAKLESQGYRVLAGINGDFYGVSNGVPMGLVVTDGVIRSCSSQYYAAGFLPGGSAILGMPELRMELYRLDGTVFAPVNAINKVRSSTGGIYAFTHDFNPDHDTGNNEPGVDVICSVVSGRLSIGGQVTLLVDQVIEATAETPVPEGKILLTANNSNIADSNLLRSLFPGNLLTLRVESSDHRWSQVTSAVGAMYSLIENGQIVSGLDAVTAAPRTAIGQKADGSLIFYTMDGRQAGYSVGISMLQLAQRLLELGCVTALCLDGGGSTTLVASYPSSSQAELINSPSDGKQRNVSNHIFLVSRAAGSGMPAGLYLSTDSPYGMPGGQITLRSGLYDYNYLPLATPISYTVSGGSIEGNVLTLPEMPGTVTITASAMGLSQSATIQVVSPTELSFFADGKKVDSLDLTAGSSLNLSAAALYQHLNLPTSAGSFHWAVTGDIGSIEPDGRFTAALRNASGAITLSCGASVLTIPVTITGGVPYVDIEGHWAAGDLGRLYLAGIMTGTTLDDGTVWAYPDNNITRQEFALLIYRYLGLSGDYADVLLPFEDAASIADWALPAVRAMYQLGIMGGSNDNDKLYCKATSSITRADAMTMIGRLLNAPLPFDLPFTDSDAIPSYALPHVQTLVAMGIVGGFDDGTFQPGGKFTRGQAARIFYGLMTQKNG